MVLTYFCAQMIPVQKKMDGFLLVLSTSNIDEGLVGYGTKYDCSSGDINVIGGLNKINVIKVLTYLHELYPNLTAIKDILSAKPSAELVPIRTGVTPQTDEEDMGLTYKQIKEFNDLRNLELCGIVSTFQAMSEMYPDLDPLVIRGKCEAFFSRYFTNRHKSTISTPGPHLTSQSIDNSRCDLRPFLYDLRGKRGFNHQWGCIDKMIGKKLKK